MAKATEHELIEWDEPPLPLRPGGSRARRSYFQQLSLLHIMVALVYFAVVFWAVKQLLENDGYVYKIVVAVLVGLGTCVVGLWAAMKLTRFAFIGWIIFVVGYLTITGATTTFFAIPTVPILIGSIIYVSAKRRSNNQDALLWVLAVASDRGMPLAPGIRAFSNQVSGIYEVWTASLDDLLRQGVRLSEALDSLPRLVPPWSLLLIRMGEESGHLALGLREAVDSRSRRQPILRAIGARMAYLGWVVVVALMIVGFVTYFILPKFEAIFKDFGIELPEVTKLMIRATHVVVDYFWVGVLGLLGASIYAWMVIFGSAGQGIPLFDRLFRRRHTCRILRSLAIAVSADRPIPLALGSLGQWYPTSWVRKKLARASLDASQGVDWTEALFENGMISSSEVGALVSAQRAGNLAWALRELAETGERRWVYRLQAGTQVLFVVTMLVLGALALLLTLAYFSPLTTLITRLAE